MTTQYWGFSASATYRFFLCQIINIFQSPLRSTIEAKEKKRELSESFCTRVLPAKSQILPGFFSLRIRYLRTERKDKLRIYTNEVER
ncbi:hypothetical protein AAHA92_33772 [Salvia divinorum]|uniref:Ribosomal protein S10 n=1 Tax=Salvia divinorum TaxID=28513 RepID=A0ABD1FHU8_SALDI